MKKKQKGFTLVELLVVIAILAVLATVSILGYSAFTKKANISNDEAIVSQMNMALLANETIGEEINTVQDAIDIAMDAGFVLGNLQPQTKGYEIIFDMATKRFYLYGDNKVQYRDTSKDEPVLANGFKVIHTANEENEFTSVDKALTYNAYLYVLEGETPLASWKQAIYTKWGLDVGNVTGIATINYKNDTQTAKNVIFSTSGQMTTLNLDGLTGDNGDTIYHYGFANIVNVNGVGNKECYHESGTANEVVVKAGKVVVESVGSIFELKKSASAATDGNAPTFENKGNVLKAEAGTLAAEEKTSDVYNINNYDQLCSFRDATNSGKTFAGITVKLNCDITLTEAWVPISNYWRKAVDKGGIQDAFAGTFDGQNHTITGLTNEGLTSASVNTGKNNTTPAGGEEYVYGFFASVNNATIKNLTFKDVKIVNIDGLLGDCNAACVGFIDVANTDSTKVQIDNIHVYGTIEGYDNVGGVVGMARNLTSKDGAWNLKSGTKYYFTVKDCSFDGTLIATRRSAGIVAQMSSDISLGTIIGCSANGSASSDKKLDKTPDNNTARYLCGGLVIWGQTKILKVENSISTMKTSNSMSTDTVKYNADFIIVEANGGSNYVDYSKQYITQSGTYKKLSQSGYENYQWAD